jgi:hypothetical protein
LIQRPVGERDELYNLTWDPRERVNVIDDHPDEARRLSKMFGSYYRLGSDLGTSGVQEKGIQGKYELASGAIA